MLCTQLWENQEEVEEVEALIQRAGYDEARKARNQEWIAPEPPRQREVRRRAFVRSLAISQVAVEGAVSLAVLA